MHIAYKYFKNESDAALSVNDSFIKICNNIEKYNIELSFLSWSKTILIRTIIDSIRKDKKFNSTIYSTDNIENFDSSEDVSLKPKAQIINSAMEKLPKATNRIIKLYFIDELSHKEISELLDITIETSKWHVKTGKKKLKEILSLKE